MTILLSEPERKRDMPFTFLKVVFEHTLVLTVYFEVTLHSLPLKLNCSIPSFREAKVKIPFT